MYLESAILFLPLSLGNLLPPLGLIVAIFTGCYANYFYLKPIEKRVLFNSKRKGTSMFLSVAMPLMVFCYRFLRLYFTQINKFH